MAAIDQGQQRIARDPHTNRCTALNARGLPCGAWAMRGEDVCFAHSMSEEEWLERSRKGGRTNAKRHASRRAQRELLREGISVPFDTHEDALRRLAAAQQKLEALHAEGRISDAELPTILRPVR